MSKEECEFCGNKIEDERRLLLAAHFSQDLAAFRSELNQILADVDRGKLAEISLSIDSFYAERRLTAGAAIAAAAIQIKKYNVELGSLSEALHSKSKSPFETIPLPVADPGVEQSLKDLILEVNKEILANNRITSEFASLKTEAIGALKLHFAAEFALEEGLETQSADPNRYRVYEQLVADLLERQRMEIDALEAAINLAQKGREDINERLSELLGSSAIQIEVVKEADRDKFRLVRGKLPAKNLSEGEKTAIALSFFLSKLKEEKSLGEVIIYIDDPISSLDSNHIFQVYSILRDVFFKQEKLQEPWKVQCRQLFISTHNFDFFSLIRDLPAGKKEPFPHYLVRRVSVAESVVVNLPKTLRGFRSEYHYLYSVIRDFHLAEDKSQLEGLFEIPNVFRRFLELYTMARMPSREGVEGRATALFGAQKARRILKVLHTFSHLDNLDRLLTNSNLIADIEGATSDLMEALKEDSTHHQALESVVA